MKNFEMRKLVVKATEAMCTLPVTHSVMITASDRRVGVALYTYDNAGGRASNCEMFEAWFDHDYIKKSIELDKLVRKIKALEVREK